MRPDKNSGYFAYRKKEQKKYPAASWGEARPVSPNRNPLHDPRDPPSDLMMLLLGKTKVWAPDWISI